jgi:hypothetical protein
METSEKSQLPEFEAERYHLDDDDGSHDLLKVRCERCGSRFWVTLKWKVVAQEGSATDGRGHRTRPCPYCFKVSWLPGESPDSREPALFKPERPKRVVKRRRSR